MYLNLGRNILHTVEEYDGYFEGRSPNSSFDGVSSSVDTLKEDIRLIKLESLLFDESKDLYEIKIDGKGFRNISGIKYKKGDILRVDLSFKVPNNITDKYTQFELQPRLFLEDSQGKESYIYRI